MPVIAGTHRDAYFLTFALPTGATYSFEVTALEALRDNLSREDLERWWEATTLDLGHIRQGNESYGEAIDRRFAAFRALGGPSYPVPPTDNLPNEGAEPTIEPTHYLGMPVVRTGNVRLNAVTLQNNLGNRRTIYVNASTPTDVWQAEVRRQLARIVQRSAPVSIKASCRYCGKAYPARQGITTPDPYCSDKCRNAAADLADCPTCYGTGGTTEAKCGDCFGSTYKPCDACQEDHARVSLMFTNPSTGTVYYVCPSCVEDERQAGGVQAPQASV